MINRLVQIISFILLSFSMSAQSLGDIEFGEASTFEAVTWNIEWFPKDGQTTVDSVYAIIEALDVDVIAFQEIGDTALFRTMIDNIPDFTPHVLNAWSGGLAYATKTSTIEVLDYFEIFNEEEYWNPLPRSPHVLHILYDGLEIYLINNHFKCCGNGVLNESDVNDEETRRLTASQLLEDYISSELLGERVILLGDLNDLLDDSEQNNVFVPFLNEPNLYHFADLDIALGSSSNWSYPTWPSHLDHIMITNALFDDLEEPASDVQTIKVDDYMDYWNQYEDMISDHRPVAMKLDLNLTTSSSEKETIVSNVAPNPADVQVIISLKEPVESLELLDLTGQLLASFDMSGNRHFVLDTSELNNGVYIIRCSEYSERLVVRH